MGEDVLELSFQLGYKLHLWLDLFKEPAPVLRQKTCLSFRFILGTGYTFCLNFSTSGSALPKSGGALPPTSHKTTVSQGSSRLSLHLETLIALYFWKFFSRSSFVSSFVSCQQVVLESRFELQLYLDQQMPPVLLQQFLVELLQQMRREILREILYPLALDFTSQRSISTASSQCQLALGVSTEAQPLVPRHASHKRPNEESAKTVSSGLTESQELPTQGPQDPPHCTKAAHTGSPTQTLLRFLVILEPKWLRKWCGEKPFLFEPHQVKLRATSLFSWSRTYGNGVATNLFLMNPHVRMHIAFSGGSGSCKSQHSFSCSDVRANMLRRLSGYQPRKSPAQPRTKEFS